jgi:hypothetical protein
VKTQLEYSVGKIWNIAYTFSIKRQIVCPAKDCTDLPPRWVERKIIEQRQPFAAAINMTYF